jgi:hypothetical protein
LEEERNKDGKEKNQVKYASPSISMMSRKENIKGGLVMLEYSNKRGSSFCLIHVFRDVWVRIHDELPGEQKKYKDRGENRQRSKNI